MFQIPEDTRLSKNFTLSEFACHDGSKQIMVDGLLVDGLQIIRDKVGKPVEISSGYRTESYNASCGGITDSEHTKGKAADIKITGITPFDVAAIADSLRKFNGIGVYPTFTHVDVGNFKGYWYQDTSGHKTFYPTLEALRKKLKGKV